MEQPFTRIFIPSIETITNFRLGIYFFWLKNFTGNNVTVWFDLKKKKNSKTKISLLDHKVAPIQTEGNKKPQGVWHVWIEESREEMSRKVLSCLFRRISETIFRFSFKYVYKIRAMYQRLRVNVKLEPRLTFTRGLSYIASRALPASIIFTRVHFTCVRT